MASTTAPRVLEISVADATVGYTVPRGATLRFVMPPPAARDSTAPAASSASAPGVRPRAGSAAKRMPVALETNLPPTPDVPFDPERFYRLPMTTDELHHQCAEVKVDRDGFFEWRVVTDGAPPTSAPGEAPRRGFFGVEPTACGGSLPLSGIAMQTFITKLIGPLPRWPNHFRTARESGYNCIHFTPVQPLGVSSSAYCVRDQLDVSEALFAGCEDVPSTAQGRLEALGTVLRNMREEYKLVPVVDVVLSHTAVNTPWLREHPEAGYSLESAPHLLSAFALDIALRQFSVKWASGAYGGDVDIATLQDVDRAIACFKEDFVPQMRLWEYYVMDVKAEAAAFSKIKGKLEAPSATRLQSHHRTPSRHSLTAALANYVKRDKSMGRFSLKADATAASRFFASEKQYEEAINDVNLGLYHEYDKDIAAALTSVGNVLKWEHLDPNGPRKKVSAGAPLTPSYFTLLRIPGTDTLDVCKIDIGSDFAGVLAVANHGWVMNGHPFTDFAGPGSKCYVRREVIVWEDCAKLRYGTRREDNPWLWSHMASYVRTMAQLFDGFRVDNCHSVPLPALQYLLWQARVANASVLVFAELFAPSFDAFHMYVSSCGIHALLREGIQPGSAGDLCSMLYDNSGAALSPIAKPAYVFTGGVAPANPAPLTGWVFDLTHDNEPPTHERTATHTLPLSALVSMCSGPTGSTRGFDELLPFKVDVVTEKRPFRTYPWEDPEFIAPGIMRAKGLLGRLHEKMALDGYSEVYVSVTGSVVSMARHNPVTHSTIHMLANTAFKGHGNETPTDLFKLSGRVAEIKFAASLDVSSTSSEDSPNSAVELCGLHSNLTLAENCRPESNEFCELHVAGGFEHGVEASTELRFKSFPPGSIICLRTELSDSKAAIARINEAVASVKGPELLHNTPLTAMNVLLYCSPDEERSESSLGAYDVPGVGVLPYSGIQGWKTLLDGASRRYPVDMGHALFAHLRQGNWALDWTIDRLSRDPSLSHAQHWLRECFLQLKLLPRFLIPKYFAVIINKLHAVALEHCFGLMSPFVHDGSWLVKALALGSVQLFSDLRKTPLIDRTLWTDARVRATTGSLAAGLPHFATGFMRCWGRDTFIALKGLLILTGRVQEAADVILAFAGTVRHGLIPNLLDCGRNPRFNARDATWWFLAAVVDYISCVPSGAEILRKNVFRRFPPAGAKNVMPLHDVIQEIMTAHANGISFREVNAGTQIDDKMQDEGFNVSIRRDEETGFLFGGNRHNCGTWMDKMGESRAANNWGTPATPRDGAPVEITALLKKVLSGLASLHSVGHFPHAGASIAATGKTLEWGQWAEQVQKAFHYRYFIPVNPTDDTKFNVVSQHVGRRGFYRDTVGSSHVWTDYQMRPNALVAMAIAPELFLEGRQALYVMEPVLRGPLGMKTLDPSDWSYRGSYSGEETTDYHTSKGFNYHQGPEWVWPYGYYLIAKMNFDHFETQQAMRTSILSLLRPHIDHLKHDKWQALPELTNVNGAFCYPSCPCQAWSMSTILEALDQLQQRSK